MAQLIIDNVNVHNVLTHALDGSIDWLEVAVACTFHYTKVETNRTIDITTCSIKTP